MGKGQILPLVSGSHVTLHSPIIEPDFISNSESLIILFFSSLILRFAKYGSSSEGV